MHTKSLTGLYAITDRKLAADSSDTLADQVDQALSGGASIIQYRDKGSDQQQRIAEASSLLKLCRSHQAPLIINDDLSLAAELWNFGISFAPSRPREGRAILDEAASWRLPDWMAPISLKLTTAPPELLDILAKYKAPPS